MRGTIRSLIHIPLANRDKVNVALEAEGFGPNMFSRAIKVGAGGKAFCDVALTDSQLSRLITAITGYGSVIDTHASLKARKAAGASIRSLARDLGGEVEPKRPKKRG